MSDKQDKFMNAVPLLESTAKAHQGQKNTHQGEDFKGKFREAFPQYHPIIEIAPSQIREVKPKKTGHVWNNIISLLAAILSIYLSLETKVRSKAHGALFGLSIIETIGRLSLIESLKEAIKPKGRFYTLAVA